tara:strand:+ start:523 stop:675 length:153 start_codon:yes stop_codon:yes gene_type:complete
MGILEELLIMLFITFVGLFFYFSFSVFTMGKYMDILDIEEGEIDDMVETS